MQRERKSDLVLLGIPAQVIPIGKVLSERGYSISYLFGDEAPEAASRLISKVQKGVVTVGAAPSLRHRKVINALMRCRKRKASILIDNPYNLSTTVLVDKIIELVKAGKQEFDITPINSRPKDNHDQITGSLSYYNRPHRERATAWYRHAVESFEEGWIQDAIAFCESALRSDPSHEDSLCLREELRQVVKNEANVLEYIDKLVNSQKNDQALRVIQFTTTYYPNSTDLWLKQAHIYLVCHDFAGAVKTYETILTFDKQNLSALVGLSTVHFLWGNYGFAADFAKQALRIDSKKVDALINLSGAYVNTGKPKDALEYANKALQIAPKDYVAWNNKGHALMQLGRFLEAKTCFMEALRLKPDYQLAWLSVQKLLSLGY